MSIFDESKIEMEHGHDCYTVPTYCFLCGMRLLDLPLIMWQGNDCQIWFHKECARDMSAGLLRDYYEIKKGKEKANVIYKELLKS